MTVGEIQTITIRYDGLDSEDHRIELGSLAESLTGLNRILWTISEFAISHKYIKSSKKSQIRIYAKEPIANCFSIEASISFLEQIGLIPLPIEQTLNLMTAYLVFKTAKLTHDAEKAKKEFEKFIAETVAKEQKEKEKLLQILDMVTRRLQPSLKKAVKPIGETSDELRLIMNGNEVIKIDKPLRDAILEENLEIEDEKIYQIKITELDLINKTCKIEIMGDELRRHPAEILDPEIRLPENFYSKSLSNQKWVKVKARAGLVDGYLKRLYIISYK